MTYVNLRSVTACGILFPILGAVAVALRFAVRHKRKTELGVDDWICIPALILLWAEGGLQIAGAATHSFGWHSPSYDSSLEFLNDDEPSVEVLGKLQTAFDLLHPTALGLLKLSICFFYRRLFRGSKFNIVSWIAIGTIVLWIVAFTVTIAAACGIHFDANWASLLTLKEECVDTFRMLLTYTITDVAVDLGILIIPIPLIFGLQMPLRRKLAICGIILVGALAIACGITRMVLYIQVDAAPLLANARVAGLLATDDIGVVSLLLFWGMVELGVGMIAICLPTLRPLFHGWSAETIIRSIRSVISLRAGSSSAKRSADHSRKSLHKLGSESSVVGINMENIAPGRVSTEVATAGTHGSEDWRAGDKHREGDIRIEREFFMSSQQV